MWSYTPVQRFWQGFSCCIPLPPKLWIFGDVGALFWWNWCLLRLVLRGSCPLTMDCSVWGFQGRAIPLIIKYIWLQRHIQKFTLTRSRLLFWVCFFFLPQVLVSGCFSFSSLNRCSSWWPIAFFYLCSVVLFSYSKLFSYFLAFSLFFFLAPFFILVSSGIAILHIRSCEY